MERCVNSEKKVGDQCCVLLFPESGYRGGVAPGEPLATHTPGSCVASRWCGRGRGGGRRGGRERGRGEAEREREGGRGGRQRGGEGVKGGKEGVRRV